MDSFLVVGFLADFVMTPTPAIFIAINTIIIDGATGRGEMA